MNRKYLSRRAGALVPLFSVHSKNSAGIGDFVDMKLVLDWCKRCGFSILQLLPMNEFGAVSCPYDAISSFALEPVYLSLKKKSKTGSRSDKRHVDYRVKKEKIRLLWDIFTKEESRDSKGFKGFIARNDYWIGDFALYKALKGHHDGKAWYEWPKCYKERDASELDRFGKSHAREIRFHMWVQWLAFRQFKNAKRYAERKGILLKGDLPILVSRDSADVWAHREFFKLDFAAGAPPDMYCAKGQRWGMPTYNWEAISNDGHKYVKEKLKFAENFYDILRIDHVVGLFRIWSIPYNDPPENKGLNGRFDPEDEGQWEAHGRRILSAIVENTKMLICAEDLGIIPRACPKVMEELDVPGNDVQRWMKDWNIRHDFLKPEEYRKLSVAMLSTHDTTNWPAWWEYEAGTVDEELFGRRCVEKGADFESLKAKLFNPKLSKHGRLRWRKTVESQDLPEGLLDLYENTFREKEKLWARLNMPGPMREKANKELVKKVLGSTLASNSIFSINTLIDLLFLTDLLKGDPYKYRINTPGTVSEKNWSLTLPLPLEGLAKYKICSSLKKMNTESGRD